MSAFLFALSVCQASFGAFLSLILIPYLYRMQLANPPVPCVYTEILDKVEYGIKQDNHIRRNEFEVESIKCDMAKSNELSATFLKYTFAHALADVEVSTLQRKLTNAEGKFLIPLQENLFIESYSSSQKSYI